MFIACLELLFNTWVYCNLGYYSKVSESLISLCNHVQCYYYLIVLENPQFFMPLSIPSPSWHKRYQISGSLVVGYVLNFVLYKVFWKNEFKHDHLHSKVFKRSSLSCLISPYHSCFLQILLKVKDQHKIVGLVVWHEQLCNGLNLRKTITITIYIYIFYIGLILLTLNKAGFRFEKVPIYVYLTK